MKIEYITSNQYKFDEARLILSEWELEQVNIELTEIQGTRSQIIHAKAHEALRILKKPLIVEDVSLYCAAIGGLPGPYIKDFLIHLGAQGLYELIHKYEDHSAEVYCTAAYITPHRDAILFDGKVEGTIVPPRGQNVFRNLSWNPIFQPVGWNKTYSELTMQELSQLSMRKIALTKLKHYLENEM